MLLNQFYSFLLFFLLFFCYHCKTIELMGISYRTVRRTSLSEWIYYDFVWLIEVVDTPWNRIVHTPCDDNIEYYFEDLIFFYFSATIIWFCSMWIRPWNHLEQRNIATYTPANCKVNFRIFYNFCFVPIYTSSIGYISTELRDTSPKWNTSLIWWTSWRHPNTCSSNFDGDLFV